MQIEPELIKNAALAAVATWGVTEALKPLIWKHVNLAWERSAIRLLALAIGGAWGFALGGTVESATAGVCGAALSTMIVAALRKRIEND